MDEFSCNPSNAVNHYENQFNVISPEQKNYFRSSRSSIKVSVTDPKRKGEGIRQYTIYKVNTISKDADGQVVKLSVSRRYSDFDWLHQRLFIDFKGILIPPLPEKSAFNRFSTAFIHERRRGLELFLTRVVMHPHIGRSEHVKLFLSGDDESMLAIRERRQSMNTAEVVAFIKESVQNISNIFGKGRDKTENDEKCQQVSNYIWELHRNLASIQNNCEYLLQSDKDLSRSWFQFHQKFKELAMLETIQENDTTGELLNELSLVGEKLSNLMIERAEASNLALREPMKDFVRTTESAKTMMKTRSTALINYNNSLSNIEDKRSKLNAIEGIAAKEDAIIALEKSLVIAQMDVDQYAEELHRVTGSCITEFDIFKNHKRTNMRKMVIDFCKSQIDFAQKEQEIWTSFYNTLV